MSNSENAQVPTENVAAKPVRKVCEKCGDELQWRTCWDCGGECVTHHDCGEDTCCCLDPGDNVTCGTCYGGGGWKQCRACYTGSDWDE